MNRPVRNPRTPPIRARRLRGPFALWPRTADAILAIVVFLATVLVSEQPNQELAIRSIGDVPIVALLVFAAASGALYWRRSKPLVVLGVALAASALTMGLEYDLVGALIFSVYAVGRYGTNDRWGYIGLAGALALTGIDGLISDVQPIAETGADVFGTFVVWYVGRRIRFRGERAARLEREQADEANRVVTEERTRIARELHDVVAHRVSLMTVQAGAAKTVAADDPERARQAMEAVEQAGRQALDELRHLLGILRPEAGPNGLGPQPGLADVPRLVDQFREAGLDVSLSMDGVHTILPARVDLFAYRIIQESLTNVLKHAGPGSRAEVRLSTDDRGISIEVLDNGHGPTNLPGSSHGIVGMRERALLLGGKLDAGPRSSGGFQVLAHLPIGEEGG